ncbi:hypothetical protein AAHC03_09770 [Spirometra sp. Aus1]
MTLAFSTTRDGSSTNESPQTFKSRAVAKQIDFNRFAPVSLCEEDLIQYLTNSKRTVEDLLNVDIRDFSPEHRMICLESLLQSALAIPKAPFVSRPSNNLAYSLLRRTTALSVDRLTEVTAISMGIEPTSIAVLGFLPISSSPFAYSSKADEPAWLQDDRFKLLLLSTVSGARDLPRPRLLVLAACLRQLSNYVSGKAFASVLRLITVQINEASPSELVYIGSLVSELPRKPQSLSSASPVSPVVSKEEENDETSKLAILGREADLLRDALQRHIMNRLVELETLGLLPLIRLGYDFGAELTSHTDKLRFLGTLETVISTRPKEQNLFTLGLLFYTMQKMNMYRPGLVRRCLGQIRRKLHLTVNYPQTDQSAWLSSSLAALANLTVGGPLADHFSSSQYTRLSSLEAEFCPSRINDNKQDPVPAPILKSGLDVHGLFTSDWVRQLFFDVADYVADHNGNGPNLTETDIATDLRTFMALLLLGVRHPKLLERCLRGLGEGNVVATNFRAFVDLLIAEPSQLLVNREDSVLLTFTQPTSVFTTAPAMNLVRRLPRVDWQLYYELASVTLEANSSCLPLDDDRSRLLQAYLSLKQAPVESFITQLQSRVNPALGLDILPFHFVEMEDGKIFFADIVLRKKSGLDPSLSKYALCFICWKRDSLVPRPIASLVSSYNKTCPIPVFPFIFSDQQNASEQGRSRDEFLKKVASLLKETRGVPSDTTLIHPAHKFLVTS